jgi:hypothetical protein
LVYHAGSAARRLTPYRENSGFVPYQENIEMAYTIDECRDAQGFVTIRRFDGSPNGDTEAQPIATVYVESAAPLFAASPDMLAALESAHYLLSELRAHELDDPDSVATMAAIEAAIRKARPDTPTG